jgi:hypothetical protein
VKKESLFVLPIGILETQFDLLGYGKAAPANKNRIIMNNDIIGISNGTRNKVMEFSSYGDLLSMYYHPQQNPKPITLLEDSNANQDQRIVNKKAHPYFFEELGEIAYTRNNTLLAEDHVPNSRRFYDEETGVNLRHVVIRFDKDGSYRDYIGQEGIGGTPFPFIEDIIVNKDDHIIVISKTPESHQVYWFNSQGDRLYTLTFTTNTLPDPAEDGYIPTIARILPAASGPYLYLHINSYPELRGETNTDLDLVQSGLYRFNIATEQYDSSFPLPENIRSPRGNINLPGIEVQYLYQLIGQNDQGYLFFISPADETQHQIIIMDPSGRVVYRSFLSLSDDRVLYRDMSVTPKGIVLGLLGYNEQVEVVWWRTDLVLE